VSATPRTPSGFRGFQDIQCPADNLKSDGQPSRTSRTDSGRVQNVTELLFFLDRGGNTSQKNKNRGISDFSQIHVCFGLSDFQNLLFCLKLRWGWVFVERTRILSEIQFTTHFIEFFVVETKEFVGSSVNVILTQQTFGLRSSRVAEGKHRALGK